MLSKKDLEVVFLQEIKVYASYFDTRKFSFGFTHCLAVDRFRLDEGLVLLWKQEIELEIIQYSSNFIYGKIFEKTNQDF